MSTLKQHMRAQAKSKDFYRNLNVSEETINKARQELSDDCDEAAKRLKERLVVLKERVREDKDFLAKARKAIQYCQDHNIKL